MPAMSREQIANIQEPIQSLPPEDTYDSWFKYEDPTTMTAGARNSLRMLANVPYSTFKVAQAAYDAGTDLYGVGKILLKGIAGSGEVLFQELGLQDYDTENTEIARSIGKFYIDRIKNPGRTLVEDPIGALLDITPVAGAAFKATRLAGMSINPLRTIVPATTALALRGANVGARVGRQIGALGAGFASTKSTKNFAKMYTEGKAGRRPEVQNSLLERTSAEDIAREFRSAVSTFKENASKSYRDKLPALKAQNRRPLRLDLGGIKNNIIKKIVDDYDVHVAYDKKTGRAILNFETSAISNNSVARRMERTVREVENWSDSSPAGMDILKRRVWGHHETDGSRFAVSNSYNNYVFDEIRTALSKVPGYDDLVRPFEDASKATRLLDQVLSAASENPETVINKLTKIMDESPGSEIRLAIIERLEKATGKNLSGQIAGLELSELTGKGLFGKGIVFGAIGNLLHDFPDISMASIKLLGLLPLTSPQTMGRLFLGMGATNNQVNKVVKFVSDVHKHLPEVPKHGITLLAAVEHIDQVGNLSPGDQPPRESGQADDDEYDFNRRYQQLGGIRQRGDNKDGTTVLPLRPASQPITDDTLGTLEGIR